MFHVKHYHIYTSTFYRCLVVNNHTGKGKEMGKVEKVNGDVVATVAVELEDAVREMFSDVDSSKLPQEVNEKTNVSQGYEEFEGVNADGDKVPVRVYDLTIISDIKCIRASMRANNITSLQTAARLSRLVAHGAYQTFGVNSPEKLNEILHLGIGKENARKWLKVGQLFLDVKEDGTPTYKDIDGQHVPHLPVSTLVFMTKLVKKDDETGELDYTEFFDFVKQNNITALSSQGTVRGLLTTSKPKEEKSDNESETDTDATAIAQGSTRATDLARSLKGFESIDDYVTRFKGSKEVKEAMKILKDYLLAEENQRAKDTAVVGSKADAWVLPYEA